MWHSLYGLVTWSAQSGGSVSAGEIRRTTGEWVCNHLVSCPAQLRFRTLRSALWLRWCPSVSALSVAAVLSQSSMLCVPYRSISSWLAFKTTRGKLPTLSKTWGFSANSAPSIFTSLKASDVVWRYFFFRWRGNGFWLFSHSFKEPREIWSQIIIHLSSKICQICLPNLESATSNLSNRIGHLIIIESPSLPQSMFKCYL